MSGGNGYKFIVLEGISGSGKTELGTRLSRQISAKYYTTPPSMFGKIREEADRILCLRSRFLFYLSSVIQASWEIGKILETQSVVCDKYLWSTICYHRVYGLDVEMPPPILYRKPDYTFLVVCEDEKRIERLFLRGAIKDAKQHSLRQENERRCLIEFRKYLRHEIDNTVDGPQHAIDKILAAI
ncbi:MAG: hypothetical protein V1711_02065 [bacterium]